MPDTSLESKLLRNVILAATIREGDTIVLQKLMAAGVGHSTAYNLVTGRYPHKPSVMLKTIVNNLYGGASNAT